MKTFIFIITVFTVGLTASTATAKSSIEERTEKALIEAIKERAVYPDEAVLTVRTLRPSDPALFRRAKFLNSLVLPSGESGKGTVTAKIQIRVGGSDDSQKMLWVMAQIDAKVPTLVANRAITRGSLLFEEDLSMELKPLNRSRLNMADVVGKIARRSFRSGDIIRKGSVKAPIVVKRGDVIDASIRGGSFQVQTKAEAMGKGGIGDFIRARILRTGKVVRARIYENGAAELLL